MRGGLTTLPAEFVHGCAGRPLLELTWGPSRPPPSGMNTPPGARCHPEGLAGLQESLPLQPAR